LPTAWRNPAATNIKKDDACWHSHRDALLQLLVLVPSESPAGLAAAIPEQAIEGSAWCENGTMVSKND